MNKVLICSIPIGSENTGIGKYISLVRLSGPFAFSIFRQSSNIYWRAAQELFFLIRSVFFPKSSVLICGSERDAIFGFFSRCRKILVVHDHRPFFDKSPRSRIISFAIRHSKWDKVVCVSKLTRFKVNDVMPGIPLSVIYNPIITKPRCSNILSTLDFALFVGSLEDRKNPLFIADVADSGLFKRIKIVISKFYFDRANIGVINRLRSCHNIDFIVDASEDDLMELYSTCQVYLSFSSFEGFGRTYIEAQAMGAPVVALRNNVTDEILGESALLLESLTISEVERAIGKLVHLRDELVNSGYRNSERFDETKFLIAWRCLLNDF